MAAQKKLYIATTSSAVLVNGESDFVREGDLAYFGAKVMDDYGDLFVPVADEHVRFQPDEEEEDDKKATPVEKREDK